MGVPLIAGVTAAGRGLAAYLAKKQAMKTALGVGKNIHKGVKSTNRFMMHPYRTIGRKIQSSHPRAQFFERARRLGVDPKTARQLMPRSGVGGFAKNLGIASLAGIGGLEIADRVMHPREEAMNALRVSEENLRESYPGLPGPTVEELEGSAGAASKDIEEVERTGKDYDMDYITQDQRDMINHFSKIDSMNLTHQAKEMLKEDYLRKRFEVQTGAAYTGGEVDTFMGIVKDPRLKGPREVQSQDGSWNSANDTAEWNPGENIYPRHFIDTLLREGVITLDDIFDMGASDGDSWKIIPRGRGRTDKYRKLV